MKITPRFFIKIISLITIGLFLSTPAFSQEQSEATPTPASDISTPSPCGKWKHYGKGKTIIATLSSDGTAISNKYKTKGAWHWLDESKNQFQIEWENGIIDTLTISQDGKKVMGSNNHAENFRWDRP